MAITIVTVKCNRILSKEELSTSGTRNYLEKFDKNGQKVSTAFFKDKGKRICAIDSFEKGKKVSSDYYDDNAKRALTYKYNDEGKIISSQTFDHDGSSELVENIGKNFKISKFDQNGKLKWIITKDSDGNILEGKPNGLINTFEYMLLKFFMPECLAFWGTKTDFMEKIFWD